MNVILSKVSKNLLNLGDSRQLNVNKKNNLKRCANNLILWSGRRAYLFMYVKKKTQSLSKQICTGKILRLNKKDINSNLRYIPPLVPWTEDKF